MRAIIMTSATHNIEGPSIIVRGQGDLKDGAGAVIAGLGQKALGPPFWLEPVDYGTQGLTSCAVLSGFWAR